MPTVISKDGTRIGYEKKGAGPAVILVDGALCSRAFGPMPALAPLLAEQFTVYTFDRRGRGESGDTQPYSREREFEDLAALVAEAGGDAAAVGLSSGGALALLAAADGVPFTKVVAYEPPYVAAAEGPRPDHQGRLKQLVGEGKRGAAVRYFMRDMVGAPAPLVLVMSVLPFFGKMKQVAHTLPYDAAVMGDFTVPAQTLGKVNVPALVMHGTKTDPRLQSAAATVASLVPGAKHDTLPDQTHNVNPKVLTPKVVEFLRA